MGRANNQTLFFSFNLLLLLSFVVIGSATTKKPTCLVVYGVENGDTCYAIAEKYLKESIPALSAINPNINCANLFVGQWVCVIGQP
ncbi:hypothetical protein HS088_TW12G00136 [Tripterygium wilfordii]|uniref:LysM domain-containing protein n=1 Tax=Tripterygium wilfordii TaxID=458696 RepID=A0A7J7CXZ7_TRIWF|nr:hypothetical protein HS088_TW12G00136 [Tripterygium wilfordii]